MNDSTGSQPHDQGNPFAAPQADVTALPFDPAMGDAERTRREYISHEVSLKSIGLLYYLGGGLGGLYFIGMIGVALYPVVGPREMGFVLGAATVYVAIAAAMIVLGRGLRTLKSWIRIPVGIVSVLGLLGFPCGTIISIYVLYLVISPKAAVVLSPQYQQIITQTPHVRFKTSPSTWIVLAVFILLLVGLFVMVAMGA